MSKPASKPIRSGYAIFCPTVFQGTMPACYEGDYPLAFATQLEAQREIANHQLIRRSLKMIHSIVVHRDRHGLCLIGLQENRS